MGKAFSLFAIVAAAVTLATAAWADELEAKKAKAVGGGYQIAWVGKELRVKKGKRSAVLEIGDGSPKLDEGPVDVRVAGDLVMLSYPASGCEKFARYTRPQLEARLVVEEAARLLRGGKHSAAAAAFAQAQALDKELLAAARGRAEALVALGKLDEASLLLGRLPNSLREYLRVIGDAKLAPLLQAAPGQDLTLGGRRVDPPGTAQLDGAKLSLPASGLAINHREELVSVETSGGHGLCSYSTRLVFRDTNLKVLAALPLVEPNDYADDEASCEEGKPPPPRTSGAARVAKRVAFANRMLAELGFSPLAGTAASASRAASGALTAHFGDVGLVVGDDGSARYFHKQRMIGEYGPGTLTPGLMTRAVLSPAQNRVLVVTKQIGCEREEQVSMSALPLPVR